MKKLFLFLIFLCLKNITFAQTPHPLAFFDNYQMPYVNAYASHTEGNVLGIHPGYTTLGVFVIPNSELSLINPLFDIKSHYFNDGKVALNVGAGLRYFSPNLERIFGFSLFYDFYRTHHDYQQVGPSLELLGSDFDIRVNGYIPVGNKSSTHRKEYRFPGGWFSIRRKHESALYGIDAEIGTQIKNWTGFCFFESYVAFGPYFYCNENRNISGARVRLNLSFTDYLEAEVDFLKDSHFNNTAQIILILNIPLFEKNKCFGFQPVQRQEIIVREKHFCWESNF